jgi:hypothetical protein
VATAIERFAASRDLSNEQRRDIGVTVLTFVDNGADAVLSTSNTPTLSRKRRQEMIEQLKRWSLENFPEEDVARMTVVLDFFIPLKGTTERLTDPSQLPGREENN